MPEILKSVIGPLEHSARVQSVFGEPVAAHGKTIIPVARIAYAFGGGSGKGTHQGHPGEGEGGGGGVVALPLGVVEITDSETRFVPLDLNRKLLSAGLIGLGLGLFWGRRTRRRGQVRGAE
jgi:uncharacterized spore protein YtfJ